MAIEWMRFSSFLEVMTRFSHFFVAIDECWFLFCVSLFLFCLLVTSGITRMIQVINVHDCKALWHIINGNLVAPLATQSHQYWLLLTRRWFHVFIQGKLLWREDAVGISGYWRHAYKPLDEVGCQWHDLFFLMLIVCCTLNSSELGATSQSTC